MYVLNYVRECKNWSNGDGRLHECGILAMNGVVLVAHNITECQDGRVKKALCARSLVKVVPHG